MHHVDRNSGILQPEEKFSAEQRHAYQENFLQGVVDHAYRSGTLMKRVMDAAGLSPADIRSIEDLHMIYPLVRFGTGDLSSMVTDTCACGRTGPRLSRIMGRVDQLTKVKGMFVHPSQVQKVLEAHPMIQKGRLVVDRVGDQDVMTLEVELASAPDEDFIPAVEHMIHEAINLKGSVRILEPRSLKEEDKIICDVRKWD